MIQPLKKPKTGKKLSYYRNKADKALQELGRETYDKCLVCGKEYSCLHHFFPKSRSSVLRYNWSNLINICQGCHFSHHCGDPRIHIEVIKIKGQEWFDELEWKHNNEIVKPSKGYYLDIINKI